MSASITIRRQRNTQRSPKSTTGNDPAPDRLVVQTQNDDDTFVLYPRVIGAFLTVSTGLGVRGRRLSQKEKEISVQVSFGTLL